MLAPWRKSYDQLSILESRNITLPTKVHLVQALVFPVDMYGCESWTIKKSWALKNWCFWTVVLEKILENPLDWKESQPVNPKGISLEYSEAETPLLWPPDAKNGLIGKDPDAGRLKVGGEGDDRGWDGWMPSQTQWTGVWVGSGSWWWTGKPGMLQSMGLQRVGHDSATELNWKAAAKNLTDRSSRIPQHLSNSWENWLSYWNWILWVLPFPGPLLLLTLILTYDPCLMCLFSKFLQHPLQAFTNRTIHKLLDSLRLSETSTPHKSPWPTFQPFLISPPMMPLSHRKQLWKIDVWPLS